MRTILKADKGYIYTDGEIYGRTIYLAEGKSEKDFYEITEMQYKARMEEAESDE